MIFGHILVSRNVMQEIEAAVGPVGVVVAMTHGFDKEAFVVRRKAQRCGARPERQRLHIVVDVLAHFQERRSGRRIARRPQHGFHRCSARFS